MAKEMARTYFQDLFELLIHTQVTDQEGASLSLEEGTDRAVEMILSVGAAARKVLMIGNGGSAAIVSHIQNDLCKAANVRGLVFNEQPLLTAISNDIGYESVFELPVGLWANAGDLLLAVSSSGQSENILRGVRAAADHDCRIITLSGFGADNQLRRMGHLNFYVPGQVYGYVETAHMALAHCITDRATKLRGEAVVREEEYA
ncbi:MAG TPA: SIS domain-containing protein [Pyrinomonadaceae bacterium]|jgi:D-sedoheptulose 7-phosphate isomerase